MTFEDHRGFFAGGVKRSTSNDSLFVVNDTPAEIWLKYSEVAWIWLKLQSARALIVTSD